MLDVDITEGNRVTVGTVDTPGQLCHTVSINCVNRDFGVAVAPFGRIQQVAKQQGFFNTEDTPFHAG